MTTRANNKAIFFADCACIIGSLAIYQAKGKRAYLYARCTTCGEFSQAPHDVKTQSYLWNLLPDDVKENIQRPLILSAPADAVCPCCGKAAA